MSKARMNIWGSPSDKAKQYAKERAERIKQLRNPPKTSPPIITPGVSAPSADPVEFPQKEEPKPRKSAPKEPQTEEDPIQFERVERFRIPTRKRRRHALSISVSEEEEELLRTAASKAGMTFSGWVRHTLFKAMGRKPPRRPR